MSDLTPYQKKIVKRYYDNLDTIKLQRLAELAGELYLATGKKLEKGWKDAAHAMAQIGVPASRIEHLVKQRKPELLAELVRELERKK